MGYTKLEIYNLALWNLGVKTTLQSTSGNDPKIAALNLFYDVAREQCLKDYDWSFARCYRDIALTQSAKSQNPRYKYEFDYPDDCLSAREIVSVNDNINIDFEPACNYINNSRVINTNINAGILRYTKNLDKESFFTPEFVLAFSWLLSFYIADGIGFSNKKENASKVYASLIQRAIAADACEGYEDKEPEPSYLYARQV